MDEFYLTEERKKELEQELETLKGEKRIEVAEHLKRAKEYGDLSENAEYVEAREEKDRTEQKIAELEELLKSAKIIKKMSGSDRVHVGSTIAVKKGKETVKYTIVGSNESNPKEMKISNESPLGKAFIGRRVGDRVTVDTPGGSVEYRITRID